MKRLVVALLLMMCSLTAYAQYTSTPPAYTTSPGAVGQYSADDKYFYMVIAPNQWKRVAWDSSWAATPTYVPILQDDFNRGSLGSAWAGWTSYWTVINNQLGKVAYAPAEYAIYPAAASTFTSGQYVQVKVLGLPDLGTAAGGFQLRRSLAGPNYLELVIDREYIWLYIANSADGVLKYLIERYNNGVLSTPPAVGDVFRMEITKTNIVTILRNGVIVWSRDLSAEPYLNRTGYPALLPFSSSTAAPVYDDVEMGNIN